MFINPSSKKSKVYWINSEGVRNQMNMDIKSFLPSLMVIPLYMKGNKLPPYLLSGGSLFKGITKATHPSQKFNIKFIDNRKSALSTPKIELFLEPTENNKLPCSYTALTCGGIYKNLRPLPTDG